MDNLAIKSCSKDDHLQDPETVFYTMRKHQLKINYTKFFLGDFSGKFLGFVDMSKDIHLDPKMAKAIQEMQPPKKLQELQGLQERLSYIQRFVANVPLSVNPSPN